jgi:predicted transcriptional regulator
MSKQKLHNDLKKLRNEINNIAAEDTESRDKLNQLISELEIQLENPDGDVQDQGVLTSVKEAIEHFETNHPRATAILNDIMVTLSNMGI